MELVYLQYNRPRFWLQTPAVVCCSVSNSSALWIRQKLIWFVLKHKHAKEFPDLMCFGCVCVCAYLTIMVKTILAE